MVRTTKGRPEKPRFGALKGKIIIHDPNWWKPMTDQELDATLGSPLNADPPRYGHVPLGDSRMAMSAIPNESAVREMRKGWASVGV